MNNQLVVCWYLVARAGRNLVARGIQGPKMNMKRSLLATSHSWRANASRPLGSLGFSNRGPNPRESRKCINWRQKQHWKLRKKSRTMRCLQRATQAARDIQFCVGAHASAWLREAVKWEMLVDIATTKCILAMYPQTDAHDCTYIKWKLGCCSTYFHTSKMFKVSKYLCILNSSSFRYFGYFMLFHNFQDMPLGFDSEETCNLLAVLLPYVSRCVEAADIDAAEIIETLKQQVGRTEAPRVPREVDRTLRQMPLSALLGLMVGRGAVRPWLEQQVEVLRSRLS